MRTPEEDIEERYADSRTPAQQAALDGLPQAMANFHASGRKAKQLPSCTYGAKLVLIKDRNNRSNNCFALVIEGQEQGRGQGSNKWSRIKYGSSKNE